MLNKAHTKPPLKLTPLRQQVLDIFSAVDEPLSAYEVLNKLKQHREGAEAATVYRVIEYFLQHNVLHRIDSQSKFMLCKQSNHEHKRSIIFVCKKCKKSDEVINSSFYTQLDNVAKTHHFYIPHTSTIEIKAICKKCH